VGFTSFGAGDYYTPRIKVARVDEGGAELELIIPNSINLYLGYVPVGAEIELEPITLEIIAHDKR
jgi:hypothetical protein